jgi:hypothetical protein
MKVTATMPISPPATPPAIAPVLEWFPLLPLDEPLVLVGLPVELVGLPAGLPAVEEGEVPLRQELFTVSVIVNVA